MAGDLRSDAAGAHEGRGLAEVLLVDDTPTMLGCVAAAFDEAGFAVSRAPLSAVRQVGGRADVVVVACDELTPLADLAWLRHQTDAAIAVVLPHRSRLDPVAYFACGVDTLWRMPLSGAVAVAGARALLRRRPPGRQRSVASYGTISVDADVGAIIGGRPLSLDATGLLLLEQLLRDAARRVTPRAQLAAVAGLVDAELDGQIRRLRMRLEEVEGWRRIVTVRGVGFRLVEAPTVFTRAVAPDCSPATA